MQLPSATGETVGFTMRDNTRHTPSTTESAAQPATKDTFT